MSAHLSSSTKALLQLARGDAPSVAAKAKVWAGVAGATGAAAAGAGTGVTAVAGASAVKMLLIGTLLGGTVTVGIATMVLRVGAAQREEHAAAVVRGTATVTVAATATATEGAPAIPITTSTPSQTSTPTPTPTSTPTPTLDPGALVAEASLVAEARGALARGDARGALRLVRAARALSSRQLAPEELALESQALRALGRDDEANASEAALRSRYPESALAR